MNRLNAWDWDAVEADLRAKTGNACGGDPVKLLNPLSKKCVTIGLVAYKKMRAELQARHASNMHKKATNDARAMKQRYNILNLNAGLTLQQLQKQLDETKRRANAAAAAAAAAAAVPAAATAAAVPAAHLDDLRAARANRNRARAELQALQRELDELKAEKRRLEANLSASDNAAAALGSNFANLQAQKSRLQAQLRDAAAFESQKQLFQARIQDADAAIDTLELELQALQRAKNASNAAAAAALASKNALEARLHNVTSESAAAAAALKNALRNATAQTAALQQAKNVSNAAAAKALANKNALEARLRNVTSESVAAGSSLELELRQTKNALRNATAQTAALQQAKNASNAAAAKALRNKNALEDKLKSASGTAALELEAKLRNATVQTAALQRAKNASNAAAAAALASKNALEARLRNVTSESAAAATALRNATAQTAALELELRQAKNASSAAATAALENKSAIEARLRNATSTTANLRAQLQKAMTDAKTFENQKQTFEKRIRELKNTSLKELQDAKDVAASLQQAKNASNAAAAAAQANMNALEARLRNVTSKSASKSASNAAASAAALAEMRQRLEAASTLQSQLQTERERLKTLEKEIIDKNKQASSKLMTNVADAGVALYELCVAKARYLKRRKHEAEFREAEKRKDLTNNEKIDLAQKMGEYNKTPEGFDVPWWAILMYNPNRDGLPATEGWDKKVEEMAKKAISIVTTTYKEHGFEREVIVTGAERGAKEVLGAIKVARAEAKMATSLPVYSANIPVMNFSSSIVARNLYEKQRALVEEAKARATAAENALQKERNELKKVKNASASGSASDRQLAVLLFRAQAAEDQRNRIAGEMQAIYERNLRAKNEAYRQQVAAYAQEAAKYAQVAHNTQAELARAQAELARAQAELERVQAEAPPLNYETVLNTVAKKRNEALENVAALQQRLENDKRAAETKFAALQQRLENDKRAAENAKRAAETTFAAEVSALKQQVQTIEKRRNEHKLRADEADQARQRAESNAAAAKTEHAALVSKMANLRAELNTHKAAGSAANDTIDEEMRSLKAQIAALDAQSRLATEQKATFENLSLRNRASAQAMANELTRLRLEFATKEANYEEKMEALRDNTTQRMRALHDKIWNMRRGQVREKRRANAAPALEPPQKQRPEVFIQQLVQPVRNVPLSNEQLVEPVRNVGRPRRNPSRTIKPTTKYKNYVKYGNALANSYSTRSTRSP